MPLCAKKSLFSTYLDRVHKFWPDRRRRPVATPHHRNVRSVQWRAHEGVDVSASAYTNFFSSHYMTPSQCWAHDLARRLNSSRSSWVHGCGRMGQTSRCFIVCSVQTELYILELRPILPEVTPLTLHALWLAFPAVTLQHSYDAPPTNGKAPRTALANAGRPAVGLAREISWHAYLKLAVT